MKTLTRCCVRAVVLVIVLAASGATSAAAQVDVCATAGAGVYESDAFCLDSNATFTVLELCASGDLVGASLAYSNGSHPWMGPPTGAEATIGPYPDGVGMNRAAPSHAPANALQEEAFLTNGDAIRIMAEAFPVAALSRIPGQREGALGTINRYVRPFLGAGVYIAGDGATAPAGTRGREFPTLGLEGFTSLILSYGAKVYLPGREMPVRLVVLYRGNTMFVGDVAYRTPDGRTLRGDGETLTWGEWGIGVSFRIGG